MFNHGARPRGTPNYPKSAAMGVCPKRLKKEFETAVVYEQSMFEPLKFYCNLTSYVKMFKNLRI